VVGRIRRGRPNGWKGLVILVVCMAFTVAPTAAAARIAYVAVAGTEEVVAFDTDSGQVVAAPIQVEEGSGNLALTPDGRLAVVSSHFAGTVSLIDTQEQKLLGPAIDVAHEPNGIAISPDGRFAYVVGSSPIDAGALTTVDLATRKAVGKPIDLKGWSGEVAVTPDGRSAFVTQAFPGSTVEVDLLDGHVIGPVQAGPSPYTLVVTPDGSRLYVVNGLEGAHSVSVIDTASGQPVGPPIEVGLGPGGIAISPDGRFAYVANYGGASVSVIDTRLNQVVAQIPVAENPAGVTFSPDGQRAYVTTQFPAAVEIIDTQARQVIGGPFELGGGTQAGDVAVTPDQGPVASFSSSLSPVGLASSFDASGSSDPEGQSLRYDWSFGDGHVTTDAGPFASHVFGAPGTYDVGLTVTDTEGCSAELIYTGQTAYCNGSSRARQTQALSAVSIGPAVRREPPRIRLRCPAKAISACRYRFRVVATKKRRSRVLSALMRARVKAGSAKSVSIRPKPRFADELATASSVLIKGVRVSGTSKVHFLRRVTIVH
jgi:YVTN family beta-propeller protein